MISLKAAKPGFIGGGSLFTNELIGYNKDDIRQSIMRSVKFVFDKSLLDLSFKDNEIELTKREIENSIFFNKASIIRKLQADVGNRLDELDKQKKKHLNLWKKYGTKLPFPEIFLENETGGILLRQMDNFIICTLITDNGLINFVHSYLSEDFITEYPNEKYMKFYYSQAFKNKCYRDKDYFYDLNLNGEDMFHGSINIAETVGLLAYKLITFINAQNVSIVKCKPTNKEFDKAKIPNVSKPKYVYNIVDIYNTKKQYKSLKELGEFISAPVNKDIRAHMVRGHFKTRATGAYWWNQFVRCKDGSGKVIKHYEVHGSE